MIVNVSYGFCRDASKEGLHRSHAVLVVINELDVYLALLEMKMSSIFRS